MKAVSVRPPAVDQPPRYAVPSRHEFRVASAGERDAGALLKKADDFSWDHNDA